LVVEAVELQLCLVVEAVELQLCLVVEAVEPDYGMACLDFAHLYRKKKPIRTHRLQLYCITPCTHQPGGLITGLLFVVARPQLGHAPCHLVELIKWCAHCS
jgi:hypothetical protein